MQTKKEFINALDFKTNDIQQDDTVMLQKAINQGAKEHLPVFIPKGIYLVGALFLKDPSHLRRRGCSQVKNRDRSISRD